MFPACGLRFGRWLDDFSLHTRADDFRDHLLRLCFRQHVLERGHDQSEELALQDGLYHLVVLGTLTPAYIGEVLPV